MERVKRPPSRGRVVLVRISLVFASLLAGAVLIEFAARVRARVGGHPYSAWETNREWRNIVATVTATMQQQALGKQPLAADKRDEGVVLNPYVGFDWVHIPKQVHDELEYFQSPKSEKPFDVLIVGGSVSASFGNNVGRYFAGLLEADARLAGRPVRTFSHGRGGYKQPQPLIWVSYLLSLGYEPDLVLEIDGFNELALTTDNALRGAHPDQPSIAHWASLVAAGGTDRKTLDAALQVREAQARATDLLDRATELQLFYSAVLGPLIESRLKRVQTEFARAQDHYASLLTKQATDSYAAAVFGPPFEGDAVATGIRAWSESSRSLAAICAARSIRYLHVLQPTLHDTGAKPATEAENSVGKLRDEWVEAIHVGYPKLREAGAALAANGIHFCDASRIFEHVTQTLYIDGCHLNIEGNEMFARAIADAFLATLDQPLTKPAPVERAPHPHAKKKKPGAQR